MYLRIPVFIIPEHRNKLLEAELLADKSDIAHLKTQIANLEAKLERDQIEANKLLNVEKQEKEVTSTKSHVYNSIILWLNLLQRVKIPLPKKKKLVS